MNKIIASIVLAFTALGIAGCAAPEAVAVAESQTTSDEDYDWGKATSDGQVHATPAPTAPAMPAVSLATTCDQLLGLDWDGPLADGLDIITAYSNSPAEDGYTAVDIDLLAETVDALITAAGYAGPETKPYIAATVRTLYELQGAAEANVSQTISFRDYKAAVLELMNQCEPYL